MTVYPYSEEALAEALSNEFTPTTVILEKSHFRYFKEYLGAGGIHCQTIVIEEEYVSKDFLQDYVSYYAFCFEKYPKFCKRIHFFAKRFNDQEFEEIILKSETNQKEFWLSYQGFIVVKPIPTKIIGHTILTTYKIEEESKTRNFWGTREYTIHVFGNEVKIKSLAFQEQDSVVAACATTAIWSMLNKASVDFHTILKSPSQITKDADIVSPDGSRLFPNKGLNLNQICHAIFNSGLVSEIKQPDYKIDEAKQINSSCVSTLYLKKILNAYSAIGIPLILVILVPNGKSFGLHAVAISGFQRTLPSANPSKTESNWYASNINKMYAHDDQWGPFARIEFLNVFGIKTPWTEFDAEKRPTLVTNIIVPIYPKIRISYEDIEVIVLGIDKILRLFFDKQLITGISWDITIDFSENFKKRLKTSQLSEPEILKRIGQSMPKYLWIASCFINELKTFEFTFDATDVNNGMFGEDAVCYLEQDIINPLVTFLEQNREILQNLFKHASRANYYQFLINRFHSP